MCRNFEISLSKHYILRSMIEIEAWNQNKWIPNKLGEPSRRVKKWNIWGIIHFLLNLFVTKSNKSLMEKVIGYFCSIKISCLMWNNWFMDWEGKEILSFLCWTNFNLNWKLMTNNLNYLFMFLEPALYYWR